jgi:hypothetical protein
MIIRLIVQTFIWFGVMAILLFLVRVRPRAVQFFNL